MTPGARIAAAIEILETINEAWKNSGRAPADGILADYFKARRFMGSKDRGYVAELVYFVLRHGATLEWWIDKVQAKSSPRTLIIVALVLGHEQTLLQLEDLFTSQRYHPWRLSPREEALVGQLEGQSLIRDDMPQWARLNYPEWMGATLQEAVGADIDKALDALNSAAPVDLRVNSLKCTRTDLIFALDKEGVQSAPTPYSPHGVRLTKRGAVFTLQSFRDGWFEVQDEGSQMAAMLVEAQPGQKVIDFCAGAGGKTLAISASMQNKGRIYAWDTSAKRLGQLNKRLARAGVSNVQPRVIKSESDPFVKRHKETADWVLVDAPCSGTGTWRRNPDLKWRFTPKDLAEMVDLQHRILDSACRLVLPGGRLVYVTCSLLPDENERQIKRFINEHPEFRVATPAKIWNNHTRLAEGVGPVFQVTPHQDGVDGFFGAVLEKQ